MNPNITDVLQKLTIEEINNAIVKIQKLIDNLHDELSTLKVSKVKKEMGLNYMTIREKQRQYQRNYYIQRKQGKR